MSHGRRNDTIENLTQRLCRFADRYDSGKLWSDPSEVEKIEILVTASCDQYGLLKPGYGSDRGVRGRGLAVVEKVNPVDCCDELETVGEAIELC